MSTDHPLTSADLANVGKAVYSAKLAAELIDRMEQCGFDCTKERLQCEHLIRSGESVQIQFPPKGRSTTPQ